MIKIQGLDMNSPIRKSIAENLMLKILEHKKIPMSLREIVDEIKKIDPSVFCGQTPRNSLYSIIYRRERSRIENGESPLFKTTQERRETLYILNK